MFEWLLPVVTRQCGPKTPHEERTKKLKPQQNAKGRALLKLYEARDEIANDVLAGKVACKSGCKACCSVAVAVSLDEAEMIARYVGDLALDTSRKFEACKESHRVFVAAEKSRVEYFRVGVPCPFLDGAGVCSVYSVRPLRCRLANSVDASDCADPDGNVRRISLETDGHFAYISRAITGLETFLLSSALLFVQGRISRDELEKAKMSA